jgi:hypothetical protein
MTDPFFDCEFCKTRPSGCEDAGPAVKMCREYVPRLEPTTEDLEASLRSVTLRLRKAERARDDWMARYAALLEQTTASLLGAADTIERQNDALDRLRNASGRRP